MVVLNRVTSTTTLSNTTTETTMYSYVVPANMGAKLGEVLDLEMILTLLNNSGASRVYTLRVKFGGTTHIGAGLITVPASVAAYPMVIRVRYQNTGSSSQIVTVTPTIGLPSGDWTAAPLLPPNPYYATASIDQTAARTLEVSLQAPVATATQTIVTRAALLTLT